MPGADRKEKGLLFGFSRVFMKNVLLHFLHIFWFWSGCSQVWPPIFSAARHLPLVFGRAFKAAFCALLVKSCQASVLEIHQRLRNRLEKHL